MLRVFPWLVAAVLITVLSVVGLVLAQQVDRSQADDAPWRLASQVAADLRSGASSIVDDGDHIDLSRSLETWVVVEDAQGQATSGTGYLKDALVSLPSGTLSSAAKSGRSDVTWEPSAGLRFATVTLRVGDRFVSAGQSLAPVEDRRGGIAETAATGWLVCLAMLAGAYLVWRRQLPTSVGLRRPEPHVSGQLDQRD